MYEKDRTKKIQWS